MFWAHPHISEMHPGVGLLGKVCLYSRAFAENHGLATHHMTSVHFATNPYGFSLPVSRAC